MKARYPLFDQGRASGILQNRCRYAKIAQQKRFSSGCSSSSSDRAAFENNQMRIQRGGADPPLWMSLRFCLPSDDEKGSLFPLEQIEQRNKMAAKPVFPLLMSMAFPPMLSMLVQSMYNIVDSMFVARFSQDALLSLIHI